MLYKNGSTGAEVLIIQNNLKMLGYDPKVYFKKIYKVSFM